VAEVPSFLLKSGIQARTQLRSIFGTVDEREGEATIIRERAKLFAENPREFALNDVGGSQMAILWASVANTIPAAFWPLAYLLKDRKALDAVKKQVDEILSFTPLEHAEDCTAAWSVADLGRLTLLDSAVMEALRLTTGSMVLRQAMNATKLTLNDGRQVKIEKGEHVVLYPMVGHLDSKLWVDPLTFKPERFLQTNGLTLDGQKISSVFLPFGAGIGMCPGRFWAKNEIIVLLALLIHHCEFDAVQGDQFVLPAMNYGRVGIGVFPPASDVNFRIRFKKE